ncbi:MAG: DUF1572 family protein [Cytophagales bacterium]|nr:DUF1572 family protein [Cytophagales bacterium]
MENYLESIIKQFKYYQGLGKKAMDQVDEKSLFMEPGINSNSMAVIVKHLHGNMLSRWKDFLGSDGEKTWRNRDDEFEDTLTDRTAVYERWEEGWECLFNAIENLKADQLDHIIYIRNEGHTVMEAINRQLCHYSYHVGQLVLLGKIIKGSDWTSLSIPKGQSAAFNQQKFKEEKSRKHFTDS